MTGWAASTEIELTVQVHEVVVGDYLYVGHGWWGVVKRNDEGVGAVRLLLIGGMEFSIAVKDTEKVLVRRDQ